MAFRNREVSRLVYADVDEKKPGQSLLLLTSVLLNGAAGNRTRRIKRGELRKYWI
jgi:hypothetical protein